MNPYNPYFIPKTRYALLEWLTERYPGDKSLRRKNKDELYAIYFSIREKK